MRLLLSAALFALVLSDASGAGPDPIAWKIQSVKNAKAGVKFTVKVVAKIEPGWHLYSMNRLEEGPAATHIWISQGQPFQLAGKIEASEPHLFQDPTFNMPVEQYEGEAQFTLPVRAAAEGMQNLVVNASYQTCNNKICLPPKTVKIEAPVNVAK
jgi:thiol:disulfide interchange protein DsbD